MADTLAAALSWAAGGAPVLPLRPGEKAPAIPPSRPGARDGGFHAASVDLEEIPRLWARYGPGCGLGISGGHQYRGAGCLFVLDSDTKEKPGQLTGPQALAELRRQGMRLPVSYTVRTWSGGHHLYLLSPTPIGRRLGLWVEVDGERVKTGLDVCGSGGYWVAPPTEVQEGDKRGVYQVVRDLPIARAPDWLLLMAAPEPVPEYRQPDPYQGSDRGAEVLLRQCCEGISSASAGERHGACYHRTIPVGGLVGAGRLTMEEAVQHLEGAAAVAYGGRLGRRTRKQIEAGLRRGMASPLRRDGN